MSTRQSPSRPRLDELLAAEAALGLEHDEARELKALLASEELPAREDFMRVAGLVQASFLNREPADLQKMPPHLRELLLHQAEAHFGADAARNDPGEPSTDLIAAARRRRPSRWFGASAAGWYLAAAALFLVFVVSGPLTQPPGSLADSPSLANTASQRAALLNRSETVVWQWRANDVPGYEQVSGDVVWNSELQSGVLKLTGMPPNDARATQYQLWIVDPGRDADHPIDGGVFNIPGSTTAALIPIDAKLSVEQPVAFAITAEQPGGVVVSDGPLLIVASASGAGRPGTTG